MADDARRLPLPAPSGVVDAHTHIFPPDIVRGRERYVGRDLWFEQLYTNPKALLIDVDDLIASMEKAGIAQSIVCGFPWHDIGLCREHNAYMAEAVAASGGSLAWLGIVPPNHAEAAAEAERCFARGAVGLGEFNADAQRVDLSRPESFGAVVDVCLAAQRPMMLHASEPVGHRYPGKGTATPDRLLTFLAAYPDLAVVLAHWGGGLPFYELMPEVATLTARVVYDSAASTYLYRFPVFRAVVDVVGADRVLFASDYPILRQDRFLRRVQRESGLRDDELTSVLGDAARRVYQLDEPIAADRRRRVNG